MRELKEQIIEAVQDASDTERNKVSLTVLDCFLDEILEGTSKFVRLTEEKPTRLHVYFVRVFEDYMALGYWNGKTFIFDDDVPLSRFQVEYIKWLKEY